LGANQLTGTLPDPWSTLINLEELYVISPLQALVLFLTVLTSRALYGNQLIGGLPVNWGNLANLQFLFGFLLISTMLLN